MKVLLDTNALLWALNDEPQLGPRARELMFDTPRLIISEISLLEIAVKVSVGKFPRDPRLHGAIRELGIERARIEDRHLARLERLPLHHRDPFDRYLISYALTDDIPILTADKAFALYGAAVIDATK